MDRQRYRTGVALEAAIGGIRIVTAVGEWLLSRRFIWAILPALAIELFAVSPFLLARSALYLSERTAASDKTQVFAATSPHRHLRLDWRQSIAWRWGWWWRSAATLSLCAAPMLLLQQLARCVKETAAVFLLQSASLCAALIGGAVALWVLTRYYPAVYFAAKGMPTHSAFAASNAAMRGHASEWWGSVFRHPLRWLFGALPVVGWWILPNAYRRLAGTAAPWLDTK